MAGIIASRSRLSVRDLLLLAAVFGTAAIALTAWVIHEPAPIAGDLWLTHRIQEAPRLERNAEFINLLGVWRWLPFALVVLLVAIGRRLGGGPLPRSKARVEALFVFAGVLALAYGDSLLKDYVESPRPVADLGVRITEFRDSYGFPSGHVYGDILVYGVMAVCAPLWTHPRLVLPMRALLCAVVLVAGPARVVVGAHWPSDTAGGYLWGACALCLALAFGRWATSRA